MKKEDILLEKNSKLIQFDIDECYEKAKKIFILEAGLDGEDEKHKRMSQEAQAICEVLLSRLSLQGVYSFHKDFELKGQMLVIAHNAFSCTAFEQVSPSSIEGVYCYGITAGDTFQTTNLQNQGKPSELLREKENTESIMKQLYKELWGTAFVDAARNMLIAELKSQWDLGEDISDSFGPGFYGMDPEEMQKLPMLVDFNSIGIVVKESSLLIPLKSCAGILFKVNKEYKHLNTACQHCLGNKKTCSLCSIGNM